MIYYSLTTLMLAGIRDILIISTPRDLPIFRDLLGNGAKWGINLSYEEQPRPDGLAQAFIIGEKFIGKDNVSLILGDNIFYGHGFSNLLQDTCKNFKEPTIFSYYVNDPERYGIVVFDENKKIIDIVEKPKNPKSHLAVAGLYFYDNQVIDVAKSLQPSARGELEITDVNKFYLKEKRLNVVNLGRGFAWLDTGTHNALLEAAHYFAVLEERQGLKVACPEEVAWRMGYVNDEEFLKVITPLAKSTYGQYLLRIFEEK
jgi:glucose-1-phosphate thymidylyltransferase